MCISPHFLLAFHIYASKKSTNQRYIQTSFPYIDLKVQDPFIQLHTSFLRVLNAKKHQLVDKHNTVGKKKTTIYINKQFHTTC